MSTYTIAPDVAHWRAKEAALSRSRPADDPDLLEAQRNRRAAGLAEHVAKALAGAPPLSDEQRQAIARLLMPANGGGLHGAA